ncbi:MAG: serine hydrolase, partial [Pseudomonadota bacterium]
KSIAAILFGAFAEQNSLDIDDPVPLIEWQSTSDPRSSITPRHLLNMAGGLSFANPGLDDQLYYTDLHDHESVYFRSQTIERFVVDRPLSSVPGETFAYRNTNTLNLMAMIRRGIGDEAIISFADRAVFSKIGADSVVLETDPYGNPIITGNVYATARDWARLGDLVRRDGVIDGERLWPKGWRDNVMLKPSKAAPFYGGQMWLNTNKRFKSIPANAGYFLGWGDQIVLVIPSRNMVVVRLGLSDGGFVPYFDNLLKDLLAATK